MAIVRSSRQTLRVLEHSPRSNDGFRNPHPGHLCDGSHACALLAACPRLTDVSVSLPSVCPALFANTLVRWRGDCQVRTLGLCGTAPADVPRRLPHLLEAARQLVAARASVACPTRLTVEIFFADLIFDPHARRVHGDFQVAALLSGGAWPAVKSASGKGPYGSSGLYGKMKEGLFECIDEEELWRGLKREFVNISSVDSEADI
jgi:hypothetical protein